MPSTLTITDLDVAFGARTLFTGLDLTLADGDVTAVVGPNGSGKSTLMRTIIGELPVEHGSIELAPRHATIAWLPQLLPDPEESLLAYARRRTGVAAADVELEASTAAMASESDEEQPGRMPLSADRYARALERWLALGAADLDERLPEVAAKVGLDIDPNRPLGSLSGGQAARASLVAVLLSQLRRAAARRADEQPRRARPGSHGRLRPLARGAGAHREPRPRVPRRRDDEASSSSTCTSSASATTPAPTATSWPSGRSRRGQAWEAYESYAGARDSLVAQARQRHAWAEKGHRSVSDWRRDGQAHPGEAQGTGRPAGGEGGANPAGRRPPRGRGAAPEGVAAALHHHRGPALRRRRRHALRRSRSSWIVHPWPREPGCRTRRSDRAHGRQRFRQDDPPRRPARPHPTDVRAAVTRYPRRGRRARPASTPARR